VLGLIVLCIVILCLEYFNCCVISNAIYSANKTKIMFMLTVLYFIGL